MLCGLSNTARNVIAKTFSLTKSPAQLVSNSNISVEKNIFRDIVYSIFRGIDYKIFRDIIYKIFRNIVYNIFRDSVYNISAS
jgi:hypothetical protein